MGPLSHFVLSFILVMWTAAILNVEPTLPVWIIAIFGGLFPDFTHEKWEFIGAALISFGAAYVFGFANSGDWMMGLSAGVVAILLLLFLRSQYFMPPEYRQHPRSEFKKEWYAKGRWLLSIEYIVAFALFAFLFTSSWGIALLAFIAYGSHALADWVWYGTDFGVRHLAKYDI
ncbi:MAG TPA: hypothetical protein VJI13_02530 [Candidatus Norongarragalinales archaeon]|nr:hypothetical protein [Candidatus Norongarragalinales archaeon]